MNISSVWVALNDVRVWAIWNWHDRFIYLPMHFWIVSAFIVCCCTQFDRCTSIDAKLSRLASVLIVSAAPDCESVLALVTTADGRLLLSIVHTPGRHEMLAWHDSQNVEHQSQMFRINIHLCTRIWMRFNTISIASHRLHWRAYCY
mgnify:CR=1 FL=1